jgi:hypothetical protein
MKKLLRLGILCGVLTLLLCVGAMAAGEKGIYDISSESGFTIAAVGATGTQNIDVDSSDAVNMQNVYLNAVKVSVTYNAATNTKQYLLLVTDTALNPSANPAVLPTTGNIQYIQQDTATSTSVTFENVYPKSLTSGKTYYIYLLSDDGGTLSLASAAGTFKYYSARDLGDVNGKNGVTAADATLVLRHAAGILPLLTGDDLWAADVNGVNGVTSADATLVLRLAAE